MDDHLGAPLVQRPVSIVEALHHDQVGTHQDQQHRLGRQPPVPRLLEHCVDRTITLEQVRKLVHHHNRRAIIRKGRREESQSGVPTIGALTRGHSGARQGRCRKLVDKQTRLGPALSRCRKKDGRRTRPYQEFLQRRALAHAPPTPNEKEPGSS